MSINIHHDVLQATKKIITWYSSPAPNPKIFVDNKTIEDIKKEQIAELKGVYKME